MSTRSGVIEDLRAGGGVPLADRQLSARSWRRTSCTKGSIAVDGISLTVAGLGADRFDVQIVPFTLEHTNLQQRCRSGDRVNLECDMVGKYVVRAAELAGLTFAAVRAGEVTH